MNRTAKPLRTSIEGEVSVEVHGYQFELKGVTVNVERQLKDASCYIYADCHVVTDYHYEESVLFIDDDNEVPVDLSEYEEEVGEQIADHWEANSSKAA